MQGYVKALMWFWVLLYAFGMDYGSYFSSVELQKMIV